MFKVIQKHYAGIFKNFIFFISWPKFQICDFGQNLKFRTAIKWKKKENFKTFCKKFLCRLDIYLYEKNWLNLTCSFLQLRRFMLKMTIFLKSVIFPIIHNTAFTKVLVKKVSMIERYMSPFWKKERWGNNIYQNKQNLFFEG